MTAHPSAALPYRPDIEGLRGLAVLSVFAVHSIPDALRGGFIGVDVFFVLSGFLIASITLHELDGGGGRFDIAAFYRRRIRRLLPALLVVLLACVLFAAFWAIPADARAIGKHVVAGAAFVSNIALWSEAGYFDPSSDLKPLLHLWSLGIEEQFYLFWPLLALLLVRAGRWSMPVIGLVTALSFGLNVAWIASKPKAVFFLPPTRFWEILMGVLLAQWNSRVPGGPVATVLRSLPAGSPWRRRLPDVFAALGVALLVGAMASIDKTDHFPGWWALLPTTATCLLLAAGMQAWLNRAVLSQPLLTFYGRISYPLYLWHWPLLTLPVLLDSDTDWSAQVLLLVLAVALAVLTTYGVERPLRAARLAAGAPRLLLAGLGVMAVLGAALFASDGLIALYPERVRTIAREHLRQDPAAYRAGMCFQDSALLRQQFAADCIDPGPADAPLMLLWGDSFAATLYPGLRQLADNGSLAMRLGQFTGPLCPPLLQPSPRQLRGCREMNRIVIEQVRSLRPAVVLLAGAWLHYDSADEPGSAELDGLRDTIETLRGLGVARVVVVGSVPVWQGAQPRTLLAAWREGGDVPQRMKNRLEPRMLEVEDTVEAIAQAGGAEFLSALRLMCNAAGCEATVERDGVLFPIAHDEAHLTVEGSRRLAQGFLHQLRDARP